MSVEIPIDIQRSSIEKPSIIPEIKINEKDLFLGEKNSVDLIEKTIRCSDRKIVDR